MFAASLPDLDSLDLEAAKALLIAQHESYTATLTSRSTEIERLVLLVEKLQRMLFGTKSEKVLGQIEQLELQLEELQATNAIEERAAVASADRPVAAKPFRRPLPEHLPREIHTQMPDHEACPDCGGRLRVLGEDVAEMLERVRACFKVIRHVRPKMSCDSCDRIVQAPAPSRPHRSWSRRSWAASSCAGLEVCRSSSSVPTVGDLRPRGIRSRSLHAGRMGGRYQRVARSSGRVGPCSRDSASKLHADDTPVPVLAPGSGKTRIGRLWTYVRDDRPSGDTIAPAVWFAYSPDRKGENPRQHLKPYKGALQGDAFAGFQQLYEGGTINEVACWAHARRKFKYAGAIYLVWLGCRMIRTRNVPMDEPSETGNSNHAFRQGIATEVLNPKTALFFLSFLPQFVNPALGHVVVQFLLLGAMSVSLNTSADLLVVAFAAPLGARLRSSTRFRRNQRVASGLGMIGLGAFVAFGEK
jgi:transposase